MPQPFIDLSHGKLRSADGPRKCVRGGFSKHQHYHVVWLVLVVLMHVMGGILCQLGSGGRWSRAGTGGRSLVEGVEGDER